MNSFDLTMIVVLAVFTIFGAWRGLVREVISILTWAVACVLAWFFAEKVSHWFTGFLDEPALRQLLAFVVIFVAVFILGMVLSWLIHKALPAKRGFQIANLAFGGLFGALRGAMIIVVVFLVMGLTSIPQRGWWRESTLAPYFQRVAVAVSGYLPRDIAHHIRYG